MSKNKQNKRAGQVGAGVALGLTVATMAGTTTAGAEEVTPSEPKVAEVVESVAKPATETPTTTNTETTPPKQGDAHVNKPGGALENSTNDGDFSRVSPTVTIDPVVPKVDEKQTEGSTTGTDEKPKAGENPSTDSEEKPKAEETPTTGSDEKPKAGETPTGNTEAPKVDEKPSETPKVDETPKPAETPKVDENTSAPSNGSEGSKPSEVEKPKEEDPSNTSNGEKPKEESPTTGNNPTETPSNPTEGNKPKEEAPKEDNKPKVELSVDGSPVGADGSVTLDKEKSFEGTLKNATGTLSYFQVLPDGTTLKVKDSLIPVNSKLVASYVDVEGKEHTIDVASINSTKTYTSTVSANEDKSLSISTENNSLISGDELASSYEIYENGVLLGSVSKGDDGTFKYDYSKLSEGSHELVVKSTSKYGISSSVTYTVTVPKKEEPETPSEPEKPSEDNKPTPTPTPEPEKPVDPAPAPTPEPEKPVVPTLEPEKPVAPVLPPIEPEKPVAPIPNVPTVPSVPSVSNDNVLPSNPTDIVTPEKPVTPEPPKVEEPKVETPIVREAPRGISDITVGGNSLYGDQSKNSAVATNGDTTTFTTADSLDLRVSVDTKVVDTSRTEIKLIGRAQGELNSSDFVELHDGTYRLKGIAKDDYYTLYIRTYDSNGKLVSDTTENFSINKNGSSYSIINEGLEGHSFKSLSSNVQLVESNVDKINSDKTTIKVFRDGKEISVPKGAIKVSRTGGVNGNWEYTYSIDKSFFEEDGVYTLEVFSQTETGVKYSSSNRTIQFIIDNKAPQISITGIRDGGRYKSNEKRITIDVRDISKIKSIKAYLNGKEVKVLYDEKTGLYYYDMKSRGQDRNEFVVEVEDEAGNLATVSVKNFLLSSDLAFSIFNDDNLLYLLGGVGTAVVAFLAFLGYKRKRKLDEEDRLALEQAELLAASHSSRNSSSQATEFVETGNSSDRIRVEDLITVSTQNIVEESEPTAATGSVNEEDLAKLAMEGLAEAHLSGNEDSNLLAKTDVLLEDEEILAKTDVLPEEEELPETDVLSEDELEKTDLLEDSQAEEPNKNI